MSKKPIKKSDEQKHWLSRGRNKYIKSKLEYHLIVCEGTQTEPNYFETLKSKISGQNEEKITIKIIGKGRGTTNLLEDAKKEVQKSTNYISNVWLYNKLSPYLMSAIENAKWLESQYKENQQPSEMNPCTKVYRLVELLNKYIS